MRLCGLFLALMCVLTKPALALADCEPPPPGRNLALVLYTGPGDDTPIPLENGAPFAVFNSDFDLQTVYVRPGQLNRALLERAALFIIPGGEDVKDLRDAPSHREIALLHEFLRHGGKFFGACLGGYWAASHGNWPGRLKDLEALALAPVTVAPHSKTPEDRIEPTVWHDLSLHQPYFQDGPEFVLERPEITTVYGRYLSNGFVTSFSSDFGGHHRNVMVSGVHWEAPDSWYEPIKGGDPEPSHEFFQYALFSDLLCRPPRAYSAIGK
jgi:Biotin-protein ligase, N terminal